MYIFQLILQRQMFSRSHHHQLNIVDRCGLASSTLFLFWKIVLVYFIPQSVQSVCRITSIHLLYRLYRIEPLVTQLTVNKEHLLLFLSVSSVLKEYCWNKLNVSFTSCRYSWITFYMEITLSSKKGTNWHAHHHDWERENAKTSRSITLLSREWKWQ